ncbi:MAG: cell division protein ZapD [Aquisalimonadaceae bacterium]
MISYTETEQRQTVMALSNDRSIIFEQPLNERFRTLMRLDMLFRQADFGIQGEEEWHSRLAIDTLMDILEILTRGDTRSELIKELERVTATLGRLSENPGVDGDRLHYFVTQCNQVIQRLRIQHGQLGAALRKDEMLTAIMQRSGIAGGTCAFDLPSYHRWLQQPAGRRQQALEDWFAVLDGVRQACDLILRLVRDSAVPRPQVARDGTYQRNLDRGTPYQLIRVELPADSPWFAEISGSKHFITIRFMEQPDTTQRAAQAERDVEFILSCCVL